MTDALGRLREAMASKSPPTPFVGAGLSVAVTNGAAQASRLGLLLDGIQVCERVISPLPPGWADSMNDRLRNADLFTYLAVADEITRRLRAVRGGREFDSWIRSAVGALNPTPGGRQLIKAVRGLGQVIMTTNYDTLLEDLEPGWLSRTWTDPDYAAAFKESQVVIHLQGIARKPGSIILGGADYGRLNEEQLTRVLNKSPFFSYRFIFIGYGDGVSDLEAVPFIDFVNNIMPKERTEHYILVTGGQLRQFIERPFSPLISPVAYGTSFAELTPFLHRLATWAKIEVSQDPNFYEQRPATTLLDLASPAQEKLHDALDALQRAMNSMDQVERRVTMPVGMHYWDYREQEAVHEQLAESVRGPAANLESCAADLESYSVEVVPVFADAERTVEQLAAGKFTRYAARLAWVVDAVSELADLSGLLLRRVTLARDDLDARTSLYAGYRGPFETLYRAHRNIDHATGIALSMKVRLQQLQAVQPTGGTGRSRSAPQNPDPNVAFSEQESTGVSNADRMRQVFQASAEQIGHVFISYVREDSVQVDRLQQALKIANIPVWRDTSDLWPGEDWRAKIREAITDDALAFLVCFSRKSLARKKSYQNKELLLAIEQLQLRPPDESWLIPVRFDDCKIPELDIGGGRSLAWLHCADLFDDCFDTGVIRLKAAVLRILGRQPGLF